MIGRVLSAGGGVAPVLAYHQPRGFFDHFDGAVLSATWTVRLGTWGLAGSVATAATLAADGNNLVSNGEFTTNTAGWLPNNGAILTRRDFAVLPAIAPTGGSDDFGLEIANGGLPGGECNALQQVAAVTGGTFGLTARCYVPSANIYVKGGRLVWGGQPYVSVTAEDVWQTLTVIGVSGGTIRTLYLRNAGSNVGDLVHFDAVRWEQHFALATATIGNANATAQAGIVMPAAGVVPFGVVARYQDLANYWAWEAIPGTAGNDFQLVRMQAGVRTVLTAADIDWTPGAAYTIKFSHIGNVYTGYVNDVARLSYTDGASFLIGQTDFGIIEGKTANGGFDWFSLN